MTPYKKTNPLVVGLSRLYYPLAQYRIKHLDVRFPIETKLVKALGFLETGLNGRASKGAAWMDTVTTWREKTGLLRGLITGEVAYTSPFFVAWI